MRIAIFSLTMLFDLVACFSDYVCIQSLDQSFPREDLMAFVDDGNVDGREDESSEEAVIPFTNEEYMGMGNTTSAA